MESVSAYKRFPSQNYIVAGTDTIIFIQEWVLIASDLHRINPLFTTGQFSDSNSFWAEFRSWSLIFTTVTTKTYLPKFLFCTYFQMDESCLYRDNRYTIVPSQWIPVVLVLKQWFFVTFMPYHVFRCNSSVIMHFHIFREKSRDSAARFYGQTYFAHSKPILSSYFSYSASEHESNFFLLAALYILLPFTFSIPDYDYMLIRFNSI